MKDNDSLFGATPEGLDRLISRALEGIEPEDVPSAAATLGQWTEQVGGRIGPYKLLSTLGEGGMGTVFLAEQTQPLRRQVAVKVIKPGMDTAQVIARFEAERQALAVLDHPNIARVFHAGTTDGGRPYFVMERVKGVSITRYCDEHTLNIEERLALFLQVCEAVQHAHQKGIIHRDIKPSNILVSRQDGRAMPKIIDFGIAKAVTQSLTDRTLYTEQGQFVGTPEYMSPEQADPGAQGIDTRSDVYSMGVVLYELLTGMLPFDADTLRQGGAEHMRRVIRDEDPKTPSTRFSRVSGDTSTRLAALRRTDRRSLGRTLHGDLDWITLKAMDKDPDRRYVTAHALGQDIQRHLNHEPVTAGSPGMVYRTQKFVRRHRRELVAVLGVVILAGGLLTGLVTLRTGLNQSRAADIIRHENTLSLARTLGEQGEYPKALSSVETLLDHPDLAPRARLLHARLLMLRLEAAAVPIMANDAQWNQVIEPLKGLLGESDEIAGQAHFLLARIYLESDPEAIAGTRDYSSRLAHHRQKADALLPKTPDSYLLRALSASTGHQILACLDKALQLDPRHFESVKNRAFIHQACADHFKMAMDATLMKSIKPNDPQGYGLSALARRELGLFDEALADHDRAVELSPDEAALVDQRCQTYMRLGRYTRALEDARVCVRLEPSVTLYQVRVFFALVALGQHEQAAALYETLSAAYDFDRFEFDDWCTCHVFDTLAADQSWYRSKDMPTGKAFLSLCLADASFRRLSGKATRLIRQGEHPCFSPDGTKLAYTVGVRKSTGIAVYDMDTGQSQLLVLPGKNPVWSPDGHNIAYTRNRQTLPFASLISQRAAKGASDWPDNIREVWMVQSHGQETPRFVAKGDGAAWSRDSKRIIYRSPRNQSLERSIDHPGAVSSPRPAPSVFNGLASPNGAYEARWRQGLELVDSTTRAVLGSWSGLSIQSLNWSPDSQSLLVGGGASIWDDNIGIDGLWFCDVKSRSLSRVFQDYAYGDAVFSPDPESPRLVFVLNPQKTFWDREIWMADLSPADLRASRSEACQTVAQHHRDIISSQYDRSIDMDPDEPMNYLLRGARYLKLQDTEKALMDVENFARIEQNRDLRHDSYLNRRLEFILTKTRFLRNLINALTQAQGDSISEDSPGRRGLAWSFFYRGLWAHHRELDYENALALYRTAIRLDPALGAAFHNLAIIQATCPEFQWHAPEAALQNAARACELTAWADVSYLETYAAAAACTGDFNAAVTWQQEALTRLGAEGDSGLTAQARTRLDLYQQKKTYQQQYLWPNRLMAWWKFEQDDIQQVRDSSGHDLHGRFVGDARIFTDPVRGPVLSLDGKGDFVDCGRDCRFNLTDTISLCAWIKPGVFNKKHQALISNGDMGWNLNREASGNGVQIAGYRVKSSNDPTSLWGHLSTKTELTDGQWHHLACVYDGTSLKVFVDGQLDAQCQATGRINSNDWPVFIGENSEKPNREWHGLIDDVRIYSDALTQEEIKVLYVE